MRRVHVGKGNVQNYLKSRTFSMEATMLGLPRGIRTCNYGQPEYNQP
jgi:hypothetical protein